MLRKLVVLCALLSIFSVLALAQEPAKAEIFGGYQYLHVNSGVSGAPSFNFNGWNAAVSGYFTRNLGITADFSGDYGTVSSVNTKIYSYLFGPVVRFPNSSRVTPFAHALFGGAHISASATGFGSGSDSGFALGGGRGTRCQCEFARRSPVGTVRFPAKSYLQPHSKQLPLLGWRRVQVLATVSLRGPKIRVPGSSPCAIPACAIHPRRHRSALLFTYKSSASGQVDVPDMWFLGKAFDSESSGFERPGPACPYDAKLGVLAVVLDVKNLARPNLCAHVLQDCTQAAQIAHARQLRERPRVAVHAPNAHRQGCFCPRFPSLIHRLLPVPAESYRKRVRTFPHA